MSLLAVTVCSGSDTFLFTGKIVDGTGRGVEGAEVFVYDSPAVRRPADFISARTGADGKYSVTLPRKKYWVVARVRQGERFGPLLPGGRHSGEPVDVEPDGNPAVVRDLAVADLREVSQNRQKTRVSQFRLSGRLVDAEGKPVRDAYVFAVSADSTGGIPPFISRWTDETGEYVLFLPRGKYVVRGAERFPPGAPADGGRNVVVDGELRETVLDLVVVRAGKAPESTGHAGDDE